MPTNRKRKTRSRRTEALPLWTARLKDQGLLPERGTDDWDAFLGWYFFGDKVPGLPTDKDERIALESRCNW